MMFIRSRDGQRWLSVFKHPTALSVLFALLFGGLCILPSLFQRIDDPSFAGLEMLGPDAEIHYAARVREVYDGFWSTANTFYSAPKDQPFFQPPLPEIVIALTATLFRISPYAAFVLTKFIFGAACFFLMYLLLNAITRSPWISLLSSIALFFAGPLLAAPWDLPHFFSPSTHGFEFLRFSRAINPQWTTGWFILGVLLLFRWMERRDRRMLIGAALVNGLLIYSYVYAWTYFLAFAGLMTLFFILRWDKRSLIDLLWFWAIAGVCLGFYGHHLLTTSSHPLFLESSVRLGLHASRMPLFGWWALFFVFIGIISKRVWPWSWPLLGALSTGGFIALNQHIITGQFIVPHHYHWYFIQPLASAFAVAMVLSFLSHLKRTKTLQTSFAILCIVASLTVGYVQQRGGYEGVRVLWERIQTMEPVLTYIAKNFTHPHVVYSRDIEVLNMIPIISSVDVYTSTNANNYLVSHERARDTYFFDLWLEGVTPAQAKREFPTTRRFTLSSRLYSIYYREAAGAYDRIPDHLVEENIQKYAEYWKMSTPKKLSLYPVTILVTSPMDPATEAWRKLTACGKKSFESQGYAVYTLPEPSRCL